MSNACLPLVCGLCLVGALSASAAELSVSPATVELRDAFDGRQVLVSRGEKDVTRTARYASSNPGVIRVDERGYVTPVGDGKARIDVSENSDSAVVEATVKGCKDGRAIDFKTEIVPLLSKLGCNAGGCHGKASGQNGFRLSLFGFDAAFDHEAITREARGRRIFQAAPDQSLFLLKAAGRVAHGGGKRLAEDGEDYRLLRRWIEAGAPASAVNAPHVVKLRTTPADRVMQQGSEQQLAVEAEYSDGSRRDVTRQSEYFGNLDVVATVDASG